MKTVTLNEQDAVKAWHAVDAAVRAGGIRAAVELVPVAMEIEEQLKRGRPVGDAAAGDSRPPGGDA